MLFTHACCPITMVHTIITGDIDGSDIKRGLNAGRTPRTGAAKTCPNTYKRHIKSTANNYSR